MPRRGRGSWLSARQRSRAAEVAPASPATSTRARSWPLAVARPGVDEADGQALRSGPNSKVRSDRRVPSGNRPLTRAEHQRERPGAGALSRPQIVGHQRFCGLMLALPMTTMSRARLRSRTSAIRSPWSTAGCAGIRWPAVVNATPRSWVWRVHLGRELVVPVWPDLCWNSRQVRRPNSSVPVSEHLAQVELNARDRLSAVPERPSPLLGTLAPIRIVHNPVEDTNSMTMTRPHHRLFLLGSCPGDEREPGYRGQAGPRYRLWPSRDFSGRSHS